MPLFVCLVHTRRSAVPQLRAVNAPGGGELERDVRCAVSRDPGLDRIELVEIFDEQLRLLMALDARRLRRPRPLGARPARAGDAESHAPPQSTRRTSPEP